MNQYEFYRDIQLESDGSVKAVVKTDATGDIITPGSQEQFFNLIELDEQGRIKIVVIPT